MDLQICPIGPSRLGNLCCVTALLETKLQPQTLPYLHPFTRHLTTAESTRWRTRTFTPTFVRHVLKHQYNGGATAKAIRNKMTHLIIRRDPPNRGAPERLPLPSIRKLLDLPSMTRPKSNWESSHLSFSCLSNSSKHTSQTARCYQIPPPRY